MKKGLLIVCLFLSGVYSQAQGNKINEWKKTVSIKNKDTTTLAVIDSLFTYYSRIPNNDSVFYFAQKMFDMAGELHNNYYQWIIAARRLSERYFEEGNIDSALQLQFTALKIFENIKDSNSLSSIYINIGNAHKEYNDHKKAIYYYTKSYQIAKETKNQYSIYAAGLNLGYAYSQTGQLDSALYYANVSYQSALPADSKGALFISETMLGIVYHKLGNYQIAKNFLTSSLMKGERVLRTRFGYRPLSLIHLSLAQTYAALKQYDSTLYHARLSLLISKKISYQKGMVDAQKILSETFDLRNQIDSAYYYRKLYDVSLEILFNRDKTSAIESLTFEQNQKDKERQIALQQESEAREHNIQLALTAIAILSLLILFLLLSRSILVSHKVVAFLNVVVLLVVFEFINLLIHPFLEKITHHSPILMLLALVAIAALIVPLHHRLEHWTTHKLVEKNKAIRLANAKKTIEELEQPKA